MEIFAERLRQRLAQRRMKQVGLADKLNATRTSISRYVTGQAIPGVETLVKICETLDCSADYLLGLSDTPDGKENISLPEHRIEFESTYNDKDFFSLEKEINEEVKLLTYSLNRLDVEAFNYFKKRFPEDEAFVIADLKYELLSSVLSLVSYVSSLAGNSSLIISSNDNYNELMEEECLVSLKLSTKNIKRNQTRFLTELVNTYFNHPKVKDEVGGLDDF